MTTVSPAYFMILQFSELNDRALVYTMNTNADKTHPCGVPVFIVVVEDISHSVHTYSCLFVRKSRSNLAGMLYSASLLIRIWGCMVLKAEEWAVTVKVMTEIIMLNIAYPRVLNQRKLSILGWFYLQSVGRHKNGKCRKVNFENLYIYWIAASQLITNTTVSNGATTQLHNGLSWKENENNSKSIYIAKYLYNNRLAHEVAPRDITYMYVWLTVSHWEDNNFIVLPLNDKHSRWLFSSTTFAAYHKVWKVVPIVVA